MIRLLALALLLVLGMSGAKADDYYLEAGTWPDITSALLAANPMFSLGSFGPSFNSSFLNAGVVAYGGSIPGGTWSIRPLGRLYTPKATTATQQPNAGNFSNRVGQTVSPPWQTGTNPNVGIESIPDTHGAFWAYLSWNSVTTPLPDLGSLGIVVVPAYRAGTLFGPYGPHF